MLDLQADILAEFAEASLRRYAGQDVVSPEAREWLVQYRLRARDAERQRRRRVASPEAVRKDKAAYRVRSIEAKAKIGVRPKRWSKQWSEVAQAMGIELPQAKPDNVRRHASHYETIKARLKSGERPKRWGTMWRMAAAELGIAAA